MMYYDFTGFKELILKNKDNKGKIYAVIGNPIGHSMSPQLHSLINKDCLYYAVLLQNGQLKDFCDFAKQNLNGFNITVPFKKDVMQYLNFIENFAKGVGSVNTVSCKDGTLSGYNTDVYGLEMALKQNGIEVKGKNALILGAGGASLAAVYALKNGCAKVSVAARDVAKAKQTILDTDILDITNFSGNYQVVINCTPCGMKGQENTTAIDISKINGCKYLFDTVYNPLKTKLINDAEKIGIKCANGLDMLINQGIKAQEIWGNSNLNPHGKINNFLRTEIVRQRLELKGKKSIALCGFMGCGKSSIANCLLQDYGFKKTDTDTLITDLTGLAIKDIFEKYGQEHFRDIESEVIKNIDNNALQVISLGGGSVLRAENVEQIKKNCVLIYLDVPFEISLKRADDGSRPLLSQSREDIERLYNARKEIYESVCDIKIDGQKSIQDVCEQILINV